MLKCVLVLAKGLVDFADVVEGVALDRPVGNLQRQVERLLVKLQRLLKLRLEKIDASHLVERGRLVMPILDPTIEVDSLLIVLNGRFVLASSFVERGYFLERGSLRVRCADAFGDL